MTIDTADLPVRVRQAVEALDGCTGAAADGGRGLCLFHLHQPTGAARPTTPAPTRSTIPPASSEDDATDRTCPHCQKLCASARGVEIHIEIKHPELLGNSQQAEHQGDTVTTITELRDHQAAPDHAPEPSSNGTAKKTRVQRTDEQKRQIIAEYDAAPPGTGKTVLAHHGVHPGMVANWKKALGIPPNPRGGARAGTGPAREAPPEPEEQEPTDDPELEVDPDVIALTFDPDDLDILDALAFLDGHADRDTVAGVLLTDAIAQAGRDPKISKLVKLRNEHRA